MSGEYHTPFSTIPSFTSACIEILASLALPPQPLSIKAPQVLKGISRPSLSCCLAQSWPCEAVLGPAWTAASVATGPGPASWSKQGPGRVRDVENIHVAWRKTGSTILHGQAIKSLPEESPRGCPGRSGLREAQSPKRVRPGVRKESEAQLQTLVGLFWTPGQTLFGLFRAFFFAQRAREPLCQVRGVSREAS